MYVLVVVESPGEKHLNHEENQNCCNVVLNWKDVMAVLDVQETPEYANDSINQSQGTVKR